MTTIVFIHSVLRWLVLIALILSLILAYRGFFTKQPFGRFTNFVRHWTATLAHVQLIFGIHLAIQSPYFKYFWTLKSQVWESSETIFYGLFHPFTMFSAIVILTIGSAKAKRKQSDQEKYRTMVIWYTITLIIIFCAIPWPFSPFANRPYLPNI